MKKPVFLLSRPSAPNPLTFRLPLAFARRVWLGAFALSLSVAPTGSSAATVWREGESADRAETKPHPWWYDKVKTNQLSGGAWLSHFDEKQEGFAVFTNTIPDAGSYSLWIRANPTGARLAFRVGTNTWSDVDFDRSLDRRNIAADDKIDLRFVAWVKAGTFELAQGTQTVEFKFLSENNHHGGLDAFTLTTDRFTPHADARPGTAAAQGTLFSEEGTWPFVPPNEFAPGCLLDLSDMNEDEAGATGFIGLSEDKMSFVRGDGAPIRFWGVVADLFKEKEKDTRLCKFLAKKGVNMMRLHVQVANTTEGADVTDVNEQVIDGIFHRVAEAKKHGIYVTLSPYWAHHDKIPASWGIEGYDSMPWGLLFFNPTLQEGYRAWLKELYTRENPYTKVPLKDEPAVAIIQVKNEDSLLFWTFQGIKEPQRKILGERFAQWATNHYDSLDAALEAWDRVEVKGDAIDDGILGFYETWELIERPSHVNQARAKDQIQFLAWLQHTFYAETEAYLRDLGCKQLVNAMNWKTADPVRLEDAERWSYTANEVIAVNNYTGGPHVGPNNGYRIDPGHFIQNRSVLKHPHTLPGNHKQPVGHPFLITESAWVSPELYQTEGPFLIAAYHSLTGIDCQYWFAVSQPTWELDPRALFWPVGESHALFKWSGSIPQQIGQFPAYAIAYRRGYIQEAAEPVVIEHRALDDIWAGKVPVIAEAGKFDPNRDPTAFAVQSKIKQEVDRRAFLVGPVHVVYGSDPAKTQVADLKPYINDDAGLVKSVTGQIALDAKRGICTVRAPKFQGVTGFLREAGGAFDLGDLRIRSSNEYATFAAVSLDDQPLAQSERVLFQVGTVAKLSGWATRPATFEVDKEKVQGEEILATGKPPWLIVDASGSVWLRNPHLNHVTQLDVGGYPKGEVPCEVADGAVRFDLPSDAFYLIVEHRAGAEPPADNDVEPETSAASGAAPEPGTNREE